MSDAKAKRPTIPTPSELAASEAPAIILKSPRLLRFIVTGALAGLALGAIIALFAPGHGFQYRAVVVVLMALGFGFVGALIAGALATRREKQTYAALGSIGGFALGLGLAWMISPDEITREWMGVALLVVVGMSVFGGMLGRSFPAGEAPAPAVSISAPAAKKPVAKAPAAKKSPAATRRTKGS